MKKQCSAAFALCLLLTGCAAPAQKMDFTYEELPYGATIAIVNDSLIASQYDSRYITEAMRDAVLKYYHAVETKDTDTYASVQLPQWHDYVVNTVYQGQYTDLQLIKSLYDSCAKNFGGSFEYACISIEDAQKCSAGSEGQQVIDMLDELAKEQEQEKFSSNVDEMWDLTITAYMAKKGSGTRGETKDALTDQHLYLIEYGSEWYIIIS
ncbi:MAG: hypothetical protein IK130_07635 [Oscillospiraceae bacterium]|nr:hypothetical protein [Clostridia bacterium]MBR5372071.1 hypothetical protein [Oscillospiraceae bacterium]